VLADSTTGNSRTAMADHSVPTKSSKTLTHQTSLTAARIAEFLDQHRDQLSRFILRKLGSEEMSADILQEAYLRLSRHGAPERIENPRAFVYRVIGNLVIDYQRLSANRLMQDIDEVSLHAIAAPAPGPELRYEHQQRLQAMQQAMAELPDDCRLAFYWNRVEGLGHAEVAARLNISESMVAKHLARAMRHCRDRLKGY